METVDFKKGQRKQKFKEKRDKVLQKVGDFVATYRDEIAVFGPVIVCTGGALIKQLGRHHNLKKQEDFRNLYCYDKSLGHYWRLKRKLSNREWLEINARKRSGESLGAILSDLRVLK